ncbi:AraC family transcriptional regulator [Megalodesulfovibrio gigas]|uniref:AraC family transcriptional regulator n=1 Tax=Megalodesulfovibrio gigas TaxID=879 RepID=UPI00130E5E3F|nr:AraC family transcriptional regulator [Megalodesulfovibrio gigas]
MAGLEGVELVLARGIWSRFQPHAHDGLCVGLLDAGVRVVTLEQVSYVIEPGQLFVINIGARHQCHSPGPHSYQVLRLPAALVRSLMDHGELPYFSRTWIDDAELARQFRHLPGLLLRPGPVRARAEPLQAFVWELLRHAAPGVQASGAASGTALALGEDDPRLALAVAYIREHHAEPLRLAEVAEVAGLSACHFQRKFLRATGLSPLEFQQRERVRRACTLLESGISLAEAALAVGCCDQSQLCRIFNGCLGMAPTVWRGC